MSTYFNALCKLATQADISLKEAIACALPNLNTDAMLKKFASGQCGDSMTTEALARFFNTDESTLLGNCPVKAGPGVACLVPLCDGMDKMASQAKAWLEAKGRSVIDLSVIDAILPQDSLTLKNMLELDTCLLSMSAEVVLLPGWETYTKPRVLHAYAEACQIQTIVLTKGNLADGQRLLDGLEVPNFLN